MHVYAFLVNQICAAGDMTHQNWDSFNCKHECGCRDISLHTVTVGIETKKKKEGVNTSIFMSAFGTRPVFCAVTPLGSRLSFSDGGAWPYLD